jgi:aryl-alcohol dehydrogenase-like predicted oxidoreductase
VETRTIGSLNVSVIGVGCNNFGGRLDEARSTEVVHAALDAGLNFFDTSDSYGQTKSEQFLGAALKSRRDEAVIATKFGSKAGSDEFGAKPAYVRSAVEASLRRLGVDYIDLYQLHRPDPETPIGDTLGALAEVVEQGKVLEIGCSNFSVGQLREAAAAVAAGNPGFISVQNDYSVLNREAEREVLRECEKERLAFLPFYPLYNGLLTGKYQRGAPAPDGTRLGSASAERQSAVFSDRNFEIVENLTTYAEGRGHTLLELAFARLLAWSVIPSVIAGATSGEQVRANAAAGSWVLTATEIEKIDRLAPAE